MAFINPETRRTLNENDRRWPLKLGMRAVATLFAFIAMVLFAATTDISKRNYGGNDWVDGMPLAPVLLALFYDATVLFLSLFRGSGHKIHPGWHVGVDLIIWALAIPALVFSVGDGWFLYWEPVQFEFDGFIPCVGYNTWSHECNPLIYTLGRMEIAANVFLALILIIHFVLFVFACIATHKRRMANKRAATETRNVELQYHRSPEEHMAQQPPAYTPSAERSTKTPPANENPFNDPPHKAAPEEYENPFRDVENPAVKYA
ncbi:hypothetical protein ACLMJK_007932 [Lecanora helva]